MARSTQSAEDAGQSLREWILARMEEHIDLDDPSDQKHPWSSKDHVRQDVQFREFSPEEIEAEINRMVDDGTLIYWHGWCAPNREDVLRAIIAAEREADFTRKILVGRCNRYLQEDSDGE